MDRDEEVMVQLGPDERSDPDVVDLPEDGAAPPALPSQATLLSDGNVRFRLRKPVTLTVRKAGRETDEVVDELVFHCMTGADLRAMQAGGENGPYVGLARSARMGQVRFDAVFDRMDIADCTAALKVLDHFLGDGLKTGR